jgi:23S rRNA pseudouridine2605 synthase
MGGIKMMERILLLHKPKGYEVTRPATLSSEAYPGQKTVYALLPLEFHEERWMPVGRLDKDSTGLLLFVKEGPLVAHLQKPHNVDKVYEVLTWGLVQSGHLEKMLSGIENSIGLLKAKTVEILEKSGHQTKLKIVLGEGKNRHIRRMLAGLRDGTTNRPIKVLELKRTRMGPLRLDVAAGEWRFLTEAETDALLKSIPPKKINVKNIAG